MSNKIRTLLITLCLCVICACTKAEKPTRSSCILKLEIQWKKQVPGQHASQVLKEFTYFFIRAYKADKNKETVGPSLIIHGSPAHTLYLQFASDCESKYEVTNSILQQYKSDKIKLTVSKETIKPSINTIQVTGPYWKD